jgi:4a-hydroxytetrahydrobiopterin dehydratase
MVKMLPEEARRLMGDLPGWELDGETLRRQFTFQSFADAIAFAVRLGFAADAADHHPEILIQFKRVTLTYMTHSAGGLTQRDFDGAAAATRLAGQVRGDAAQEHL